MKKIKNFDLLSIFLWIILTGIFIYSPKLENTFIRTILGIVMVIFIPGYILLTVLFPRRTDITNIERLSLGFGMSIVVISMLGTILDSTFSLSIKPIYGGITAFSISMIIITIYRRNKLTEEEKLTITIPKNILVTIGVIFVVLISGLTYYTFTPKEKEKFTEFFILDDKGRSDGYKTQLNVDIPASYIMGITNNEYITTDYVLKIALDKNVLTSKEIRVRHNETWKGEVKIVPGKEGTNMKLEFWLFKGKDSISPYRILYLWVNIA